MNRSTAYGFALSLLVFVGVAGNSLAQEATPDDGFVTPDPAECLIEPRTLESVTALAGTPAVMVEVPSLDGAVPADEDVVATVTAIAQESVACFNAGNFLAQFAFYSDEAILAIMPPGTTADDLAGFLGADPEPLPLEARESVLVKDVMVLPDGRVTALFVMRNLEGTFTTFITLEPQGDTYIITSDIDVESESATPAA